MGSATSSPKNQEINQLVKILYSMSQVMSIVVVPISILTLGKVIHFAFSNKNFKESAPYILLQFNTSLVWICTGVFSLYYLSF